jgi:hypothetical protein
VLLITAIEMQGQLLYEWEHLKRKLRARAPALYRQLARARRFE